MASTVSAFFCFSQRLCMPSQHSKIGQRPKVCAGKCTDLGTEVLADCANMCSDGVAPDPAQFENSVQKILLYPD